MTMSLRHTRSTAARGSLAAGLRRFSLPALAASMLLLTGCATQPPHANYGHPALNQVAARPTVVVVQPAPVVYTTTSAGYTTVPAYGYGGTTYGYGYGGGQPASYPTYGYGNPAPVAPQPNNNVGRTAFGAVAGGLVGSQFGGSPNARTAATVVGAGAGAMMAQGQYSNEAAAGAAIGGLVGSRFGKGEGRNAAAALGAGLGAWMAVRD
jgi:outer membrane lipoprotein SlyB